LTWQAILERKKTAAPEFLWSGRELQEPVYRPLRHKLPKLIPAPASVRQPCGGRSAAGRPLARGRSARAVRRGASGVGWSPPAWARTSGNPEPRSLRRLDDARAGVVLFPRKAPDGFSSLLSVHVTESATQCTPCGPSARFLRPAAKMQYPRRIERELRIPPC
jgi:hypothetical protein